jgi:hypothetical protein
MQDEDQINAVMAEYGRLMVELEITQGRIVAIKQEISQLLTDRANREKATPKKED